MTPDQLTRRSVPPTRASDETARDFGHAHAMPAAQDRLFHGLSPGERRGLSRWLAAARRAGIDAAEDLTGRPWPAPSPDSVIGVFKGGRLLASWLIVGQQGRWAVACCADGNVSASRDTLADALALICPFDPVVTLL